MTFEKRDFAAQYEETVAKFPASEMQPIPIRIDVIEDLRLPPFARHFRYIMSPNKFWTTYVEEYGSAIEKQLERISADTDHAIPQLWIGVQARAMRGWFSLAREHHLYLQFMRHFDLVSRSYDLDYYHGIDVLVIYKGDPFGVRAYTKTRRGLAYSGSRRGKFSKATDHINMIDMPLTLGGKDTTEVNGVQFYGPHLVERAAKYIMLDGVGGPLNDDWRPEDTVIEEEDR